MKDKSIMSGKDNKMKSKIIVGIIAVIAVTLSFAATPASAGKKKRTSLSNQEIQLMASMSPTYEKLEALFITGQLSTNDLFRQQLIFQAAGCGLIACGKIDVYEKRIKNKLKHIDSKEGFGDSDEYDTINIGYDLEKEIFEVCDACSGDKSFEKKCSQCMGRGQCPTCQGEGRTERPGLTAPIYIKCGKCGGKGKCLKCNGKGEYHVGCKACGGVGRIINKGKAISLYQNGCMRIVEYDREKDRKLAEEKARIARKEREAAEAKAREERRLAEQKAREEREAAEAKAREERRLAEQKAREERRRLAEQKARKDREAAEAAQAKERQEYMAKLPKPKGEWKYYGADKDGALKVGCIPKSSGSFAPVEVRANSSGGYLFFQKNNRDIDYLLFDEDEHKSPRENLLDSFISFHKVVAKAKEWMAIAKRENERDFEKGLLNDISITGGMGLANSDFQLIDSERCLIRWEFCVKELDGVVRYALLARSKNKKFNIIFDLETIDSFLDAANPLGALEAIEKERQKENLYK